jgi:hypothetical protein
MISSRWIQWIAPWKWAPLIVVLTLQVRLTDAIYIAGYYLIIPIGAHLTRRYGRAGIIVLVLTGLPLLGQVSFKGVSTTPALGVYLSALLISWWLQTHRSVPNNFSRIRLRSWIVISFFILPLRIGLGSSDILWFSNVHWVVDGSALFFLMIFVLGVSRVAMRPVFIALTFAALFGLILEYISLPLNAAEWLQASRAELPWFGLTNLRSFYISYRFDSPAELLTAFGFLLFGRSLADQHYRNSLSLPSPMHRSWLIFAVLLLSFGGQINAYILPHDNPALHWFGSFYAIFLVSMLAGFYFRFAGILSMLFLVTIFWWIDAVLRADLNLSWLHFYFSMDHLLYVYGFGLLGIGMRAALAHTSTRLWNGEWFRYLGLYLLVIISLIPLDAPYDLLIISTAFFGGIAFTLWLNRIRGRLAKTEIALKGGWLSLACLIMMGYLVYNFSKGAWHGLQDAFQQTIGMVKQLVLAKKALDEEDLMMGAFVVGALVVGLWLLTSTLKGLLKSTTQLLADLRIILERLRNKVPIILKFRWRNNASFQGEPGRFSSGLLGALTWTNRVLLTALIVIFFTIIGYNTWVEYQNDLARERRYRDRPVSISKEQLQRQKEYEKARTDLVASLTLAAQKVLKDYPNVNVDHSDYQTTITSGWYTKPAEPQIRRRVYITIRPAIRLRDVPPKQSLSRSISVTLYRQDKGRFNLWVEHSPSLNWEDERELKNEIKQTIVTAAIAESQTNN